MGSEDGSRKKERDGRKGEGKKKRLVLPLCSNLVITRSQSRQSVVFTACSELFLAPSVFVCIRNILGTAKRICAKFTRKTFVITCSEKFEGQGQRSKVNVTRDKKRQFSALSPACMRFIYIILFHHHNMVR